MCLVLGRAEGEGWREEGKTGREGETETSDGKREVRVTSIGSFLGTRFEGPNHMFGKNVLNSEVATDPSLDIQSLKKRKRGRYNYLIKILHTRRLTR